MLVYIVKALRLIALEVVDLDEIATQAIKLQVIGPLQVQQVHHILQYTSIYIPWSQGL